MAYLRNNLVMRSGYSGVGGWTDTVGDLAKGALSFFGAQQRQAGATEALAMTNQQLIAQQQAAAAGGISTTTLLVGGGLLVGAAFLLLRKKGS